ncbi:MAG TPA: tRNA (N(6)-L-threonylcarbamoyladenosine(37)-C(2))-methylthiotransferase MtaB [Terriglobia bacterium]|nr:tRNA (N(6)-L-threonylcarbamoyladenosine(37)-C(2))-methylthiotransferase MtaB [Terriglobia bacterium]
MKTFHLANFGCRASQADGAALKRQLMAAGFEETGNFASSELAVLNTCTVTATADAEVRQVIRRIHRANPGCRIMVTGCYAQRAAAEIAALDGVAWVVGNSHKHRVAEFLTAVASDEAVAAPVEAGLTAALRVAGQATSQSAGLTIVGQITADFHFVPVFADDRTRPTLKVQDGCGARCAFCVIPSVRGPSRSLPPESVIGEVQALERQGFREVVLSGINLGGYGRDLGRRIDFLGLLERILNDTSIARLRISSIEPMDVSPALIRLAARESRLADHFHVPLQSGSDRILRLMNRRYWTRQYAERILAIREVLPHAGVGADVMTGFPGETAQDHAATLECVDRLPFTYLHVFPYSARPGTPAAARAEQVPGRVAHERARELGALIATKRQAFLEAQFARRLSVVTLENGAESPSVPAKPRRALSSNYLPVSLDAPYLPPNLLLDVQVGRVSAGMLHGFPVREG